MLEGDLFKSRGAGVSKTTPSCHDNFKKYCSNVVLGHIGSIKFQLKTYQGEKYMSQFRGTFK